MKTCVSFCHTLESNSLNTRTCQGGGDFITNCNGRWLAPFALDISFVIISVLGINKDQTVGIVTLCLHFVKLILIFVVLKIDLNSRSLNMKC
jgi:hypothetical protein